MQMNTEPLYFPLRLELDYNYSLGELKPYFDALQAGKARASCCSACGRVRFPPRLVCDHDQHKATWISLSGLGTIQYVTAGRNHTFAQIAMDGASNLCLGRLAGQNLKKGDRVQLEANERRDNAHPASHALFRRIN